jgi:hypothetical protein
MTFLRLNRWDWIAFAAALALLVTMAVDWYSDKQGEQCRFDESHQRQSPLGGASGGDLIGRDLNRSARECAEKHEKNAWQASGGIDRLIALVLVVAIAAAAANAFLTAAGRRFEPPRSPSAIAAWAGLAGALLILYRILQPPGLNAAAVVKVGAPLGLALVGILAIASRSASVAERPAPDAAAPGAGAAPDADDADADADESPTPPSGYEPPPAGAEPAPSA